MPHRASRAEHLVFARARKAEVRYSAQLRRLAQHVADLVRAFPPTDPVAMDHLTRLLARYAETIEPWARAVAADMVADVSRRDELAWRRYAQNMSRSLRVEVAGADVGDVMRLLMAEQVDLIRSLPLEAARRVHDLAMEGLYEGSGRASDLAREILRTGEVTKNRATLIARTETARASTVLTQARALSIGSEGYIWRTLHDSDVRPIHKQLEGTFHRWDDPPVSGERGERSHPGCIYNCRCIPAVVIPGKYLE